ncbi:MAG: DUF4162 domain-containing protein, partial [Actinomycetota bacterium]
VAEGRPAELKRTVGNDVIVARVDGDVDAARVAAEGVAGVDGVDRVDGELIVSVRDGAGAISPIAVALNGCDVTVQELTLRTPTLDDVFLELTGGHIRGEDAVA